ncbi:MAG: hypothetical protein AAGD01_16045 [Acidobacteriota bacterium]
MSSSTDSLLTPRPSSLLWRMMLRAGGTHLSMIIVLTALLVPFLWVENERGSVRLELGPVLILSIPLVLGCFAALALRTLQRIRHHQIWPGYRTGIRRAGWVLTLLAILSGALGSLLDPAIDPYTGSGLALAVFAISLLPYPNLLVVGVGVLFTYALTILHTLPWVLSPAAATVYWLGGLILIRFCLSDGLFRRVVEGPESLTSNPAAYNVGVQAVGHFRGHWGRGGRPVELASKGSTSSPDSWQRWIRGARIERYGTRRMPWVLSLLVITLPILLSILVVSLLDLTEAGKSFTLASWWETLLSYLHVDSGEERDYGGEVLLLGAWITMIFYTSFYPSPFTRTLPYPLSRHQLTRAAFGEALLGQAVFLLFALGPLLLLGRGLLALAPVVGAATESYAPWTLPPFPAVLMVAGLPAMMSVSYAVMGHPGADRSGLVWDTRLNLFVTLQVALLIAALVLTRITLAEEAPQPWTLTAVLIVLAANLLSQLFLWLQLREVYVRWDRT